MSISYSKPPNASYLGALAIGRLPGTVVDDLYRPSESTRMSFRADISTLIPETMNAMQGFHKSPERCG